MYLSLKEKFRERDTSGKTKEPGLILTDINNSLAAIMTAVRADIMLHFLVPALLAGNNIGQRGLPICPSLFSAAS